MEQRLIDANDVYKIIGQTGTARIHVSDIDQIKRIDPETLLIVQKLRDELGRVTAERDELASFSGKLVILCNPPKEWKQKLFRRRQGNMIGDYMGSGYPFIDAYNKIYTEFEEKSSDGSYEELKKATEVELQKRFPDSDY